MGTIDLTVGVAQVSIEEFTSGSGISQALFSTESGIKGVASLEVHSQVGGSIRCLDCTVELGWACEAGLGGRGGSAGERRSARAGGTRWNSRVSA